MATQKVIDLAKIYFMQVDENGVPLWSQRNIVDKVNQEIRPKNKKSGPVLSKSSLVRMINRHGWEAERKSGLVRAVSQEQRNKNDAEDEVNRKVLDQLKFFNKHNVIHTGDLLKIGTTVLLRMLNNTRLYVEAMEKGNTKAAKKLKKVMLRPREVIRIVEITEKQMEDYSERLQSLLLEVDQKQVESDIRLLLSSVDGLSGDLGKLIDMEVEDE